MSCISRSPLTAWDSVSWSMRAMLCSVKQYICSHTLGGMGAEVFVRVLQTNFRKYANGGGFVEKELAASIVAAGPKMQGTANGTA